MAKPKNIHELRDQLLDAYDWVKADPRRSNQVKEMANTAGKVIGTLKLELEYAMLRHEKPSIPFLTGRAISADGNALLAEIHKEIEDAKPADDSA
jgi:hypothetical protein